jgi:hypothetical protein
MKVQLLANIKENVTPAGSSAGLAPSRSIEYDPNYDPAQKVSTDCLFAASRGHLVCLRFAGKVQRSRSGGQTRQGPREMADRLGRSLGNGPRDFGSQAECRPSHRPVSGIWKAIPAFGKRARSGYYPGCPLSRAPAYTIEFKGNVAKDKITGTSGCRAAGTGFLGHAGEVDEPRRPRTATRGLKHPNDAIGKPPDDDDRKPRQRPAPAPVVTNQ